MKSKKQGAVILTLNVCCPMHDAGGALYKCAISSSDSHKTRTVLPRSMRCLLPMAKTGKVITFKSVIKIYCRESDSLFMTTRKSFSLSITH